MEILIVSICIAFVTSSLIKSLVTKDKDKKEKTYEDYKSSYTRLREEREDEAERLRAKELGLPFCFVHKRKEDETKK